jgi:hypothetical protein
MEMEPGATMPAETQSFDVIAFDDLVQHAIHAYEKQTGDIEDSIQEWMNARNGQIRMTLSRWLNSKLVDASTAAVQQAAVQFAPVIDVRLDMHVVAQEMHKRIPEAKRKNLPLQNIEIAIRLLAEAAGYPIEGNSIHIEIGLLDDEDGENEGPQAEEEEEAPPVIEPPKPEPILLEEGGLYGNNGIIRKIDKIDEGLVFFTVVQSNVTHTKVGAQKKVSSERFAQWAKEKVEAKAAPTTPETPATNTTPAES